MSDQENTNTEQETQEPVTETTPDNSGQDTQAENEKLFTQDHVDRIVGERLKRAEKNIQEKILESLGAESLDTAKQLIEAKRKADEAQMSELEKAQAEIEKAERKAKEAQQQLEALQAQRINDGRKLALSNAIRSSMKHADDLDNLLILVDARMQDDFNAVFEDGQITPDESKLKAFIKEVQNNFSSFFGNAGAGSPSNNNGIAPTSNAQAVEQAQREIESKFKI